MGRREDGKALESFKVKKGGYIGFFNPHTGKDDTFAMKGDMVAVSGGYLIDSESQLKGSGGGHENMPGMKMDDKKSVAPGQGGGAPPAQQPPAKKGTLKMDDMKM